MHEGRRRLVTTAINSSWRISRLRTANTLDLCAMDVRGGEGRGGWEGRREVGRDLSGGLISLVVVVVVLVFFFLPSSSSSFL